MRVRLFVHMRRHARALSISMPLPASCSSLRFDPCGAPAPALGTWRRDAQGSQCCAAAAAAAAAAHHSPPPVTVKQCGIPSVFGRGCASGPESVPETFTRRGAPLYLSQPPTEEIITPVEDSLAVFDRMAGAECLLKTPR